MKLIDIVGKSKEDASLPKEFINLISSESNEVCSREDKRTIAPEHVIKALQDSQRGGKWSNGAEMTEEKALAEQQRIFAEARARMNSGVTIPKQSVDPGLPS